MYRANRLTLAAENWQVDSLNIEPQTFCGLMEVKETVTELGMSLLFFLSFQLFF